MLESLGSNMLIVQGLGFIGFTIYTISFQLLNPRHTILMQSPAGILNGLHFFWLGSPMAAFIALSASVRDFSNGLGSDRTKQIVTVLFLLAIYSGAFFLARGWYEYCAVVGSTMMTLAQYVRDNFYRYRFMCFGHQIMWISVFTVIQSIPGFIFMVSILISNIIGIVRYMRKNPD